MDEFYAYDMNTNNFNFFRNIDDWNNQLTVDGAKNYLINHLKESLIRDFTPALKTYVEDYERTKIGKGFFSLLRMIFPYISFLGTLYEGSEKSKDAVSFMENYMGDVNPVYRQISDLIYNVYRHGLIHTNMPKVSEINDRYVFWEITFNDYDHLNIRIEDDVVIIPISPNKLFLDLVSSLDKYIDDFNDPQKNVLLLEKFKEGFSKMSRIYSESELINGRSKCKKGVNYIRNL